MPKSKCSKNSLDRLKDDLINQIAINCRKVSNESLKKAFGYLGNTYGSYVLKQVLNVLEGKEIDESIFSRDAPTLALTNSSSSRATLPSWLSDKAILEDATGDKVYMPCKSISLGSYKSSPKEVAIFTKKGLQLKVPHINTEKIVTLNFHISEILRVDAHFGPKMPILFLCVWNSACPRVRQAIGMRDPRTGLWFDSTSSGN